MKKMTSKIRTQLYIKLSKEISKQEKVLDALYTERYNLALEPFKTMGISSNATYILSGILKDPDQVFYSSYDLCFVKGDGMYFSDETKTKHAPRIFKHLKEIKFLVKKGQRL